MTEVLLSLGSNIEPELNIPAALCALWRDFGPLRLSSLYLSPAQGFVGPDFHNLVVALESQLEPLAIQARLKAIEQAQGRLQGQPKFASRTLDIDLLCYGNACLDEPALPRDEITVQAFVLRPLAELAPDQHHPRLGQTYAELWRDFKGPDELKPIPLTWDPAYC